MDTKPLTRGPIVVMEGVMEGTQARMWSSYTTYDLGDTLFAALDQKRVPLNHIKFPLDNRQTDGVLAEHILTELFES